MLDHHLVLDNQTEKKIFFTLVVHLVFPIWIFSFDDLLFEKGKPDDPRYPFLFCQPARIFAQYEINENYQRRELLFILDYPFFFILLVGNRALPGSERLTWSVTFCRIACIGIVDKQRNAWCQWQLCKRFFHRIEPEVWSFLNFRLAKFSVRWSNVELSSISAIFLSAIGSSASVVSVQSVSIATIVNEHISGQQWKSIEVNSTVTSSARRNEKWSATEEIRL